MVFGSRVAQITFNRKPADTAVIRKLAGYALKDRQQSWIAAAVGKSENDLEFDENEFLVLYDTYGDIVTDWNQMDPEMAAVVQFYQYALTIDYTLNLVRLLKNQVMSLGRNYSDAIASALKKQILSKHYVPWSALEDGASKNPKVLKALDIRTDWQNPIKTKLNTDNNGGADEQFENRVAEIILLSFPVPNLMIGLAQGLYNKLIDKNRFEPITSGTEDFVAVTPQITSYPRNMYWQIGVPLSPKHPLGANLVAQEHEMPTLLAVYMTDETGVPRPANYIAQLFPQSVQLAKAYRAAQVNDYIAAEYIEVQNDFETMLQTTSAAANIGSAISWARSNVLQGSLGQGTYKCKPGETPYFVGYEGQPVYPDEALIPVGTDASGNQMFEVNESVVDPTMSGCRAAKRFEGTYSFGVAGPAAKAAAKYGRKKKRSTHKKRRHMKSRADTIDPRYYVKGSKKLPFRTAAVSLKKGDPRGTFLAKRRKKIHRVKRRKL